MAYSVTFTLNALYTGTTQADNFTIVGQHSGGSPAPTLIAAAVTKAQLTAGVTYQVADTITGGTVTSTGDCDNSVNWTGIGRVVDPDDPNDPKEVTNFEFTKCTNDGEAPNIVIITKSNWDSVQGGSSLPSIGDTITVNGNGNFVNSVVFSFTDTTSLAFTHTALTEGDTCPGNVIQD